MMISLAVSNGFSEAVKEKVSAFEGDYQAGLVVQNEQTDLPPVQAGQEWVQNLKKVKGVEEVFPVQVQYGLLKSTSDFEGVIVRGVTKDFNWDSFQKYLISGRLPAVNSENDREILISQKLSESLNLKVNSKVKLYFFTDRTRIRPVVVTGIYNSGFGEFDAVSILTGMTFLNKILGYDKDNASFIAIQSSKQDDAELTFTSSLDAALPYHLKSRPITELYPELFDWLNLQEQNVLFIIILMTGIAIINLAGVMLVLIYERTGSIAMLMALGSGFNMLIMMLVRQGLFLMAGGILAGNILAIGLLLIQYIWAPLSLNPEVYFLDKVPVSFPFDRFMMIDLIALITGFISLFLPASAIFKLNPSNILQRT
jgi:lipoprotein-releasing system permease protein